MRLTSAILALFLSAVAVCPAAATAQNVAVAGSDGQRRDVEAIADAGAKLIAATFRERPPPPRRTIWVRFPASVKTATVSGTPPELVVDLEDDPPLTLAVHKIMRAMLYRRALELQSIPAPIGSLDWLAAALTHRLLQNSPGPMDAPAVFPPGELPTLAGLAANPVSPEQQIFHALYARWCDAALVILESQQAPAERRIGRIFELEAAGRAPADAIQLVMLDRFAARESLQDWFRRAAATGPKPAVHRLTAAETEARVNVLEATALAAIPSATAPAGSPAATAAPVIGPGRSDVPQNPRPAAEGSTAASPPVEMETLRGLYNGFLALYGDAPVLLLPSIRMYLDGVNELQAGNRARTLRAFVQARKEFAASLQRQRQVEACLDSIEKKTTGPEADLLTPYILALARENRMRRQSLAPELNAWLDQLENGPKPAAEPAPQPDGP